MRQIFLQCQLHHRIQHSKACSSCLRTRSHQTLTHTKFAILYPNSIVVTPEGTIYAGMRLFVVRLLPTSKPDEYTEQWLVPEDCEQFRREGFTCACSK